MDKKEVFKEIIQAFVNRALPKTLARSLEVPVDNPKIISLLGPRRAGKTHILFHLIDKLRHDIPPDRLVYVNFEDDRLFPLRLPELDGLLQAYYELYPKNRQEKVWFFFDEVQEVEHWEKFVRRLIDTENCRVYLTGSSSRLLSRELATSLRGRTLPFEVFPLSYEEFLRFNKVQVDQHSPDGKASALHWFDRWMKQGGFPELVFQPEGLHRQIVAEYLDLMLYRDLAERFLIKQPAMVKYMLKFMAQNMANPVSLTKVFNDLKSQGYAVGKNTVFDYASHLEEAFILFRTDIWHRSVRVQSINPSKYYLIDVSLKHALSINEDRGRTLENAVYLHLRRQGLSPHYFLEKQEVDFYWENGMPLNVCYDFYDPSTREREIKGMATALKSLGLKEGMILTRDKTEEVVRDGVRILVRAVWGYFLEGINFF